MPKRLTRASAETRQKFRSVTSHFVPVVRGTYRKRREVSDLPHPTTARVPRGDSKVDAIDGALRNSHRFDGGGKHFIGDNEHVSVEETEKELVQWQRQLHMTSGMIQELASLLSRLRTTLPPSSPQEE